MLSLGVSSKGTIPISSREVIENDTDLRLFEGRVVNNWDVEVEVEVGMEVEVEWCERVMTGILGNGECWGVDWVE